MNDASSFDYLSGFFIVVVVLMYHQMGFPAISRFVCCIANSSSF